MSKRIETLADFIDELASGGERAAILSLGAEDPEEISATLLSERVAGSAAGLIEKGIERGESVAFFAGGGIDWIAACLATVRAGAVPVPLDLQLEDRDLERILSDCAARWIVTDRRNAERVQRVAPDCRLVLLDGAAESADGERFSSWQGDPASGLPDLDPDDRALLFYTSGTTGPPKGVPLAHRHLAYQIEMLREAELVRPDDRLLLALPPHHVYPLVVGIFAPLALGIPLVLPRSLTGPQMVRALEEGSATVLLGVPRIYSALLQGMEQRMASRGRLAGRALTSVLHACAAAWRHLSWNPGRWLLRPVRERLGPRLRLLVSGGSAFSPDLAWTLEGAGWQVASGYGLTETAPLLTINPPGSRRPETVGRPVPGVEIRIEEVEETEEREVEQREDGDPGGREKETRSDGESDRAKAEGEILVRGPGVFEGYLNLEQETRESFTEDGWFRTGDLGWLDDEGFLTVSGRKSTLILSSSGEKIRTEEVERAYGGHPWIDEIGVLWDGEKLVAVIVPARSAIEGEEQSSESAIRRAVDEQGGTLPSHQRIAHFVLSRSPLERTRLGKIRRHRLRDRYEALCEGEPESERSGPIAIDEMSAPDRQLLSQPDVRTVWKLLAQRYPDRPLDPDSHMELDLGIDSLGWLDLGLEIADRTGIELPEERLLAIESARDLLQAVAEGGSAAEEETKDPLAAPDSVLSEGEMRWLAPLSSAASAPARKVSQANRMLVRGLFRLEVSGVERVPETGPVVIAPNHASYLDPFVVAAALPESIRERSFWGGWTGVAFKNRFFRLVSRLGRVFPVDPDRAVRSSLAFAAITLERGGHLVWFPEGRRSPDGELGDLRPGVGRLLEAHDDVAVVPVAIEGTYEAWPVHRRLPRPGRVRIRFGAPREPGELCEEGKGESRSERITEGLRDSILELKSRRGD